MSKFERSEEFVQKLTIDSICSNVVLDVKIDIISQYGKWKAYSKKLNAFLQFPRKFREPGAVYYCDAVEAENHGRTFYRAYKGSIRDEYGIVIG